jgi:AraC family transcriptional regulator
MKKMSIDEESNLTHRDLTYREFLTREYSFRHAPMKKEMEFYDYVKAGDEKKVLDVMTELGGEGTGRLSSDPIRNIKYHFIVTVAIITRMCADGGMEMEEAYNISDMYINMMDKCEDIQSVRKLHRQAVLDYTKRMKNIAGGKRYTREIIIAMDYIYDNLHSKIRLDEIADAVNMSRGYLSRLFHKETGISIADYIILKRVEAAKNMLLYSEYSLDEIANYLAFASTSYFISTFKKSAGMTPREYRNVKKISF